MEMKEKDDLINIFDFLRFKKVLEKDLINISKKGNNYLVEPVVQVLYILFSKEEVEYFQSLVLGFD
jgi:hypothetical protein